MPSTEPVSGAKWAVHRIRGPDAHTKSDFDEYDGMTRALSPITSCQTSRRPPPEICEFLIRGVDPSMNRNG
jgi:hypothetical protein